MKIAEHQDEIAEAIKAHTNDDGKVDWRGMYEGNSELAKRIGWKGTDAKALHPLYMFKAKLVNQGIIPGNKTHSKTRGKLVAITSRNNSLEQSEVKITKEIATAVIERLSQELSCCPRCTKDLQGQYRLFLMEIGAQ